MLAISSVSKWLHNTYLLEEIVRHYHFEERCFIMNEDILHIGLEDALYTSGFPKNGKPVIGNEKDANNFFTLYLGGKMQKMYRDRDGKVEYITNLKLAHLRRTFMVVPPVIHENSDELRQHVRATALYVIGCIVMPDTSGSAVSSSYLGLLENIEEIKYYAWGAALLARTHHSLDICNQ